MAELSGRYASCLILEEIVCQKYVCEILVLLYKYHLCLTLVLLDCNAILLHNFSPGYVRTEILKRVVGDEVSEYVRM